MRRPTVDGATGHKRASIYVTFPLLANLYLICTLLDTVWTVGDFTNGVLRQLSGAPALHDGGAGHLRLSAMAFDYRPAVSRRSGGDVGAAHC